MLTSLRRIIAISKKELLVLFGEPRSRILIILPPIFQLLIFGFAASMEVKNIDFAIIDNDKAKWSLEITQSLQGSKTFRNITYLDNYAQTKEYIDRQKGLAVIIYPEYFSRNIENKQSADLQIILDGRRSNAALITSMYISNIVSEVIKDTPLYIDYAPAQIKSEVINWFNPNLEFTWFNIPNLIGMISLVMGLIVTSLTIARERELGTFDQILVSPSESSEIALAKLVPGALIGIIHGTIFIFSAYYLFKIPLEGSLAILYISMICFSISVGSLGLMISSFMQTQQQSFLASFTVAVPFILLSGFATPIDNMPVFFQILSEANPLKHFLIISQGVFLKNISLEAASTNILKMLIIALISLTTAIWLFKRKI